MAQVNLLDIAKLNAGDTVVGLIEESIPFAPEAAIFPARQIDGTSYQTSIRTGNPAVSFRNANEGVAASKSSFRNELVQCFILAASVNLDKAVLAARKSAAPEYRMIESAGVMKQALLEIADQIWNGVAVDAKGFPGIKATVAKTDTIGVDAGGTTAATASSIYMVKFGVQDVTLIFGNAQSLSLSEFRDQQLYDGSGNAYPGEVADLMAWVGLQIGNVNCRGRIANVTADSGKTATDALLNSLLWKFPVGYLPNAVFMARRSAQQLQNSRTVTLNSGPGSSKVAGSVEAIAPWPTEFMGIPVRVSDKIGITDVLE